MRCPYCGQELEGRGKYCKNCGAPIQREEEPRRQEPAVSPYGAHQEPTPAAAPQRSAVHPAEHPMKWFKFQIYFLMFVSALGMLNSGLALVADAVYTLFNGLDTVWIVVMCILNLAVGLLSLGCAALWIYTRSRLARFCKDGPTLLTKTYLLEIVIAVLSSLGAMLILAGAGIDSELDLVGDMVSAVVGALIMIFAQKTYFSKRADLFIN